MICSRLLGVSCIFHKHAVSCDSLVIICPSMRDASLSSCYLRNQIFQRLVERHSSHGRDLVESEQASGLLWRRLGRVVLVADVSVTRLISSTTDSTRGICTSKFFWRNTISHGGWKLLGTIAGSDKIPCDSLGLESGQPRARITACQL